MSSNPDPPAPGGEGGRSESLKLVRVGRVEFSSVGGGHVASGVGIYVGVEPEDAPAVLLEVVLRRAVSISRVFFVLQD